MIASDKHTITCSSFPVFQELSVTLIKNKPGEKDMKLFFTFSSRKYFYSSKKRDADDVLGCCIAKYSSVPTISKLQKGFLNTTVSPL